MPQKSDTSSPCKAKSKCLNLSKLRQDFECPKKIILFVGAGVNMSPNVDLSWNTVLNHLFDSTLRYLAVEKQYPQKTTALLKEVFSGRINSEDIQNKPELFKLYEKGQNMLDPITKATVIKHVLKKEYINHIRNLLYNQCNRQIIKAAFERFYAKDAPEKNADYPHFHTLYQVARMILLSPAIKSVVTYNYDNFLTEAIRILQDNKEKYFDANDIKDMEHRFPRDVYGNQYAQKNIEKDLAIYHVHGYIPPPAEAFSAKEHEIVLTMDEYYESSRHVYAWQTTTPLFFLSHYTCIFIGISLTDMAMQRMIYLTRQHGGANKVYLLSATTLNSFEDKDIQETSDAMDNIHLSFLENYGVVPVYHPDGYYALFKELGEIINNNKTDDGRTKQKDSYRCHRS